MLFEWCEASAVKDEGVWVYAFLLGWLRLKKGWQMILYTEEESTVFVSRRLWVCT